MAIYFGNIHKRGKVGSSVFVRRGNVLIERAYNPFVANPQTVAQRTQRTKFKNIRQLASVIGGKNMAFGYLGNKTPANEFVKRNFKLVTVTNSGDSVSSVMALGKVQLTSSSKYAGAISLSLTVFEKADGAVVSFTLPQGAGFDYYTVILLGSTSADVVRDASELMFIKKEEKTEGSEVELLVPKATENLFTRFFVYAYGYNVEEKSLAVKYGDLVAGTPNVEDVSVLTEIYGGSFKSDTSATMYGSVNHNPVTVPAP